MTDVVYNAFKRTLMEGGFDLREAGDDIKVALVAGYTPNIDTDEFWSDVSANEVSGTGYTAGGEPLASQAVSMDTTDDEGVFDGQDVTWTGINVGTVDGFVIYQNTGTPATSRLIAFQDSGGFPVTTTGADLTIQWDAEGILNIN